MPAKPAPKGSPRRFSGGVASNVSFEASTQRRQQPHGVYCQRAELLQAQAPSHHARSHGGAAAASPSSDLVVGEDVDFRIRRFAGAVQAWGTARPSEVEGAEYRPRNGDKVAVVCPAKKVFIKLADAATGRYADDSSAQEGAACRAVYVYPSQVIKVGTLCGGSGSGGGDSGGRLFDTRLEQVGRKKKDEAAGAAREEAEFFLAKESAPAVAWWALRHSEVAEGDVFALRCTVGAPRSVVLSDGRGPSVSLVLPPPEMRVDTSAFVPRLHGGAEAASDRLPALLGLPVFAGADEADDAAVAAPPQEEEEEDHSRRVSGFLKGVRRGFAVAGEAGTLSALTHTAVSSAVAVRGGAPAAVEVSLSYDPISVVVYYAEERGAAVRPAGVFGVKVGSTHPENLREIVDAVVRKRSGGRGGSSRDDGSSVSSSTVAGGGDDTADGGYVVLNAEGEAVTLVHGALLARCAKRLTLEPEHAPGSDGSRSSGYSDGASVRREMEGNPRDLPPLCLRKIVVEVCGEDATRSVRVACRAVGAAAGGRFAEEAEAVLGEVAEEALRALAACDAGATRCRGKYRLRGPRPPVDGAAYTLVREGGGGSPARGGRGVGSDAGTKCIALQMDGMTQVAELRSAQTPSQVQKAILAAVGVAAWGEVKVLAPSLTPSTLSYASAPPFIAFESRGEGGSSAVHS